MNTLSGRDILFIPAVLILSLSLLFAEDPDSAQAKIKQRNELFEYASNVFSVNIKHLETIVFVERILNYDWSDDALDVIFANAGRNSSIGFCQVKIKTAYWIEKQLSDSTSAFFPGGEYSDLLSVSHSPAELMRKLVNDSLNILYAAGYLRIIQTYWEKAEFRINDRPDILGTLYSTGMFQPSGEIRKPNKNPESNEFGNLVLRYLNFF
jgi:hypothetical protein